MAIMGVGRTNAGGGIGTVTQKNLSAENIKKGVTIKIGDESDDDKYFKVTGTLTGVQKYTSSSYSATSGVATFVVQGMTSSTLKNWGIAASNRLYGSGYGTGSMAGFFHVANNAQYYLDSAVATNLVTITFSNASGTSTLPSSGTSFTLYLFDE